MEQSPSWEANRSSPNQEIPPILWNPSVHYHLHNSSDQSSPSPPSHFLNIHFIFPSKPESSESSLLSSLSIKILYAPLHSAYVPLSLIQGLEL